MLAASRPPVPGSALLGRTDEVSAVRALLDAPATRLVTLTGPPGVGKTTLALAVVAGRADVAWADLAAVSDPRLVTAEIARALGVNHAAAIPAAIDRDVLVLVDNCEHLAEAMPGLGDLLAATPRLRVLATSRERLHLAAEREYPVPPLPMPGDAEIGDWSRLRDNPAVAMLLDRAPAHVELTRDSARALADVCIRLDGLPLAIELAAARLRVFTPAELAFRLDRGMALLSGGPRDAPARHRDLREAIAWSHELLSERDRAVFRRLGVFPGEWRLAEAEAVCAAADVLDAITSLLDKSLIRRVPDAADPDARFSMLVSLREFAADQLSAHGEGAASRDRHAALFAAQAEEWEQTVGTDDESATWTAMSRTRADLQVAFEHSAAAADPDTTLWLAASLGWYRYTRGVLTDAERLRGVISRAVADVRSSVDARTAGLLASGVLAFALGDMVGADDDLLRVSELAEPRGEHRRFAIAHAFRGHVARERGDRDSAYEYYTRTAEVYGRLRNGRGVAWAAHDLGLLALDRGDPAEAERLLREALQLFQRADYHWAIAVCACALATALVAGGTSGTLDEAGGLLEQSLRLHDDVGDRRGIAQCLDALAEIAIARGAPAAAARLAGAAQAQRDAAATPPTDAERSRADAAEARLSTALGTAQFGHERQAGRTMPREAVRELAARIAVPGGAERARAVELTTRQREVATLVAAGHTNRQIGRELGISEKTAEIHVHNIMRRLDASSRAAVAAWVATSGLEPVP